MLALALNAAYAAEGVGEDRGRIKENPGEDTHARNLNDSGTEEDLTAAGAKGPQTANTRKFVHPTVLWGVLALTSKCLRLCGQPQFSSGGGRFPAGPNWRFKASGWRGLLPGKRN